MDVSKKDISVTDISKKDVSIMDISKKDVSIMDVSEKIYPIWTHVKKAKHNLFTNMKFWLAEICTLYILGTLFMSAIDACNNCSPVHATLGNYQNLTRVITNLTNNKFYGTFFLFLKFNNVNILLHERNDSYLLTYILDKITQKIPLVFSPVPKSG